MRAFIMAGHTPADSETPQQEYELDSSNELGSGIDLDSSNELDSGIDLEEDESITQPFDPALIRVETKPMSIDLLLQRIQYKELDLAPDFQRQGGIWKLQAKSRLIESILIRIPLPAFYMDATDEDKWIVVDGLQRLTTLSDFVLTQQLRLSSLEFLSNLEGKTYDEIPRNFQRRILETQVTVYLIAKGTPPEVKFNIFRRINTGGLPLSAQEIRHALNQGKSTELLKRLICSTEFKRATTGSIPGNRMEDREFVLRFLAFSIISYTTYNAVEFDSFLSDVMASINHMSDLEVAQLEKLFCKAMNAASEIFGSDAFRKRYDEKQSRKPINKALFESWAVNLAKLDDEQIQILKERKGYLKKGFISLMNYYPFDKAISQGTGDIAKVKRRFEWVKTLITYTLTTPDDVLAQSNFEFGSFIDPLVGNPVSTSL
jgi:hypothetical protein